MRRNTVAITAIILALNSTARADENSKVLNSAKVTKAAIDLAKTVSSSESPEFARVLRRTMATALSEEFSTPLELRFLEMDPRFTSNLARQVGREDILMFMGTPVLEDDHSSDDVVAVLSGNSVICSGTYIGKKRVLTAAHCVDAATEVVFGIKTSGPHVALDSNRPGAKFSSPDVGSLDVAVLFLQDEPNGVSPRVLAASAEIDSAAASGLLHVVGFGADGRQRGIKESIDVVVTSSHCSGMVSNEADTVHYGCIAGVELVADNRNAPKADACDGDSGGPALVPSGGTLAEGAIVSRPIKGALAQCGFGSVYVRLDTSSVAAWIALQ